VRHFLEVLDELNRLNIELVSIREQIDTGGPLGRAVVVIIGAIAELERNLIIERVRAGMRRARLEGRHIGRKPLELDRPSILRDRDRGQTLGHSRRATASPAPPSTACFASTPQRLRRTSRDQNVCCSFICRGGNRRPDAHKHILAVSKGLENRPPNSHKINGRISPIRPFHKVWVKEQNEAPLLTRINLVAIGAQ
jgi:hypothetical protein